jgi:hypothetical protein
LFLPSLGVRSFTSACFRVDSDDYLNAVGEEGTLFWDFFQWVEGFGLTIELMIIEDNDVSIKSRFPDDEKGQ